MDNLNCMFGYMMGKAMTMVAYCTFAAYIEEMLKAERKKIDAVLGHELTQENWQDYYDLQQEQTNRQKKPSAGSRSGETPPPGNGRW